MCIIGSVEQSIAYQCKAELDTSSLRSTNYNIISGYNNVLGPIVNLTYDDSALIMSAQRLMPTLLRSLLSFIS